MCIPPIDDVPAPHFALLAKIAARNHLEQLSMGMSADCVIAAQLGGKLMCGLGQEFLVCAHQNNVRMLL